MANKDFVPKVQPKKDGMVDPAQAYEGFKDMMEYGGKICKIGYREYLEKYYYKNGNPEKEKDEEVK